MSADDLDRTLSRLHQAAERISSNLVELEIDSGRQLLEASALEGESAARWSAASAALTELWRRQGLLEGVLQRADQVHRSRHADELRSLLEGPSIEVASRQVPLAERQLLGSSEIADRCRPDDLLRAMSSSFDEVKGVIAGIAGAWDTLIPKLDVARRLAAEIRGLASELGETGRRDLESASRILDDLARGVTTDPLSVPAGDVDRLGRSLQSIRDDLLGTAALKRRFEARMLEAHELLEHLRRVTGEARAAHEELVLKISVPAGPPAPAAPDDGGDELTRIGELAGSGAWREARRALDDWTARTHQLLDEAQAAGDANRAPLEARDQFRALLDAYRAKAKRLGVLEEPQVAEIFARAQETLYTAPTDLALAAQLVREYQQALGGSRSAPEATL